MGLESDPGLEVRREEAIYGRADHRVPSGGRSWCGREVAVPQARVLGGELLRLAEH